MKVLFLDIDGVINTLAEVGYRKCFGPKIKALTERQMRRRDEKAYPFDPKALYFLRNIVEETGCKIVVSSTWRLHAYREENGVDKMKAWFLDPIIRDAIIDHTPVYHAAGYPDKVDKQGRVQRGEEIYDWIQAHPEVTHYAVLDDDSDMDAVRRHFFQTDSCEGLTRAVSRKVIDHLNWEEHIPKHYRMNVALNRFRAELYDCISYTGKKEKDDLIKEISTTINNWKEKDERVKEHLKRDSE